MNMPELTNLLAMVENSIAFIDGKVEVKDAARLRATVHRLAEVSALETGARRGLAQYLVRQTALALGIIPASLHEFYLARGRGELPFTFTVPAFNLRSLTFVAARAIFRLAQTLDAGAFVFEISRAEVDYTSQRPAEYATSVMAAAITEGFSGPLFLQTDHLRISSQDYTANPQAEVADAQALIKESIAAGFYNIDLDTSTLIDASKSSIAEQQAHNISLTTALAAYIRSLEPQGITISIGGQISEFSSHNSTDQDLRAFLDGFLAEWKKRQPEAAGLSKLIIRSGARRGGVVLPDGSIARVDLDFDLLTRLGRITRKEYKLGGIVQHGASTLPETAYGKFVESETLEIHLATNFQNILFDRLPIDLRTEMYNWLHANQSAERQPGMTDEQFYYEARRMALGPFKARIWTLPHDKRTEIFNAWNDQFRKLFVFLGLRGTRRYIEKYVKPAAIKPELESYLK